MFRFLRFVVIVNSQSGSCVQRVFRRAGFEGVATATAPLQNAVRRSWAVVMAVPGALVRNLLWGLDAERPAFFHEVRYLGYNIARSS